MLNYSRIEQMTVPMPTCLGSDTIAAYVDGGLDIEAVGQVDAHIDGCPICRSDLSALAVAANTRQSRQSQRPTVPSANADPANLEPGTLLGRFVILGELGRGGMGVVVRAYDPELKRAIALKVLRAEIWAGAHAESRERMRNEAQAMARLSHANVVTIYDVISQDDQLFIAMELVEGGTLREWMGATHSWRQTLQVCHSAGLGLAAAHSAQIIHRDFKPENVLCSDDNRVLVTDFGLAESIHEDTSDAASPDALMGTPAYMAPELYALAPATEHSDQFSFCAATYEALYGQRAHKGNTWAELRDSVVAGIIEPAPVRSNVPAWVRRALCRGMAPKPGDRYPSMTALLAALSADPAVRRRRLLLAGVAIIAVTAGAFVVVSQRHDDKVTCAAPQSLLTHQWSDDHRQRIDQAFSSTNRQHAHETATRVATLFHDYRREWLSTRVEACQATHSRGVQSPALLDLRMRCLDRRKRELGEMTHLLSTTNDPKLVDRAVKAVYRLRRPNSCTAEQVQQQVPLPADPNIRAKVTQAQAVLARTVAQRTAGDLSGAKQQVQQVLARANKLGYMPLVAEAYLILAQIHLDQGESSLGEDVLFKALKAAQGARSDLQVARVWVILVTTVGSKKHRFDLAMSHAKAAEAALARVSDNRNLLARYFYAVGTMLVAKGDFKGAKQKLDEALRHSVAAFGDKHGTVGSAHAALCNTHLGLGDRTSARKHCDLAITTQQAAFGASHPNLAITLNVRGTLEYGAAKYDEARKYFDQALAIANHPGNQRTLTLPLALNNIAASWIAQGEFRRALPPLTQAREAFAKFHPNSPRRNLTLSNLASVEQALGKPERALAYYREALAIVTKVYGLKHPTTLGTSYNTALALYGLKQYDEAERLTTQVIALSIKARGANNFYAAASLGLMFSIEVARKRYKSANQYAQRASNMVQTVRGANHPDVAEALYNYGNSFRHLKQPAASIAPLKRAVAIYDARPTHNRFSRALAQYALARSLWDTRQGRQRARQLAQAARKLMASVRQKKAKRVLANIDAWLAAARRAK